MSHVSLAADMTLGVMDVSNTCRLEDSRLLRLISDDRHTVNGLENTQHKHML